MLMGLSLALSTPRNGAPSGVTISGVSLSESTLSLTLSGAATVYWLINASATQLTAAQVIAGTGATLDGSFAAGSGSTNEPIDISSLAVGDWYIHVAADNGSDTDVAAPVGFHVTPRVTVGTITPSSSGASVAWSTTGGDGTAYWVVSTNSTETDATIKAGTSVAVSASGSQTALAPSGLSASTVYYVHILHTDGDGQDGAAVHQTFTTSAASTLNYVQGLGSSDQDFNTTLNVTMPATVAAGNTLVAIIVMGDVRTITAAPSGWSSVGSFAHEGASGTTVLYKKTAAGTEGGTSPQWTSSAACKYVAFVVEVSGAAGNIEWATNDVNVDPPSIAPTGGSVERIWLAHMAGATTGYWAATAAPTGYSDLLTGRSNAGTNSSSSEVTSATAYKKATASSEDPGAFTYSGSVGTSQRSSATIAIW